MVCLNNSSKFGVVPYTSITGTAERASSPPGEFRIVIQQQAGRFNSLKQLHYLFPELAVDILEKIEMDAADSG